MKIGCVDAKRCWQLLSGVLGIFISYLFTGAIHQQMMKGQYQNDTTGASQFFNWPVYFQMFPSAITWAIGSLINRFKINPQDATNIPSKKSALCALAIVVSTLTYVKAIYLTNYTVVMMFKSCSLISVILVSMLCSRVKDKKLKLGVKTLVTGTIITVGIILFKVFDPESSKKSEKQTQFVGIVLLIVSLLADGFLPDFQAQIKSTHKPQPMEMMTQINKWVSIISFVYSCINLQVHQVFTFLLQHRLFVLNLLFMSIFSTIGQMFVYRMIKQFKQHFFPIVISTNRIFLMGFAILYYRHQASTIQFFGLLLAFLFVIFEFISELSQEKAESVNRVFPAIQLLEQPTINITFQAAQESISDGLDYKKHSN